MSSDDTSEEARPDPGLLPPWMAPEAPEPEPEPAIDPEVRRKRLLGGTLAVLLAIALVLWAVDRSQRADASDFGGALAATSARKEDGTLILRVDAAAFRALDAPAREALTQDWARRAQADGLDAVRVFGSDGAPLAEVRGGAVQLFGK